MIHGIECFRKIKKNTNDMITIFNSLFFSLSINSVRGDGWSDFFWIQIGIEK